LWKHANKLNWLYNYFLDQRIENYKNNIKIKKKQQNAELVSLKKSDPVLSEIYSQVIQQVTLRLDLAYKAFFKYKKSGKAKGFPRFRSCKNFFNICYPQSGYKLEGNIFKTTAYGDIHYKQRRTILGKVRQVSIIVKDNLFFLNIVTDAESRETNAPQESIGIDIGLHNLVVATDGTKIRNQTDSKYFDKQIAEIQRRMSTKEKGSRRYRYLANVLQRLYGAKVRKVNDFQHKVSRNLSRRYDTIFVEDLSVKKMSEGELTNLNKAIRNARFATFVSYLEYKVNHLIKVNPKNTSKTCNSCGKIHKDLKLSDRIICCSCGSTYDRDENAAKNIYCLGQAMILKESYNRLITIDEVLTFR
jgi:putative transposase